MRHGKPNLSLPLSVRIFEPQRKNTVRSRVGNFVGVGDFVVVVVVVPGAAEQSDPPLNVTDTSFGGVAEEANQVWNPSDKDAPAPCCPL